MINATFSCQEYVNFRPYIKNDVSNLQCYSKNERLADRSFKCGPVGYAYTHVALKNLTVTTHKRFSVKLERNDK